MEGILKFLDWTWHSSPILVGVVIVGYFLKLFIEKKVAGLAGRVEEIKKTSLEIKKDMRGEERTELVAYRVAIEKMEDYLLRLLFDFTFQDPSQAQVKNLYEKEQKLFLEVRLAMVKACVYLQDEKLEQRLRETLLKLRALYSPIIWQALPPLIDLQAQAQLIDFKLKKFKETGDLVFAPNEQDRELNARIQADMTGEMKKFSEGLVAQYRPMAEQLEKLKTDIRDYIYRPIHHAEVNKD